jgi:predicted nucleic acid-binding protein
MIYLDSAVVKLAHAEPESAARIRILARAAGPATVRSLDAIHLGTALHSRPGLTSFVTYDKRLLDAARTAGLPVDSPA